MAAHAEQHGEQAVSHQTEVPPPLALPLLRGDFLRLGLGELLPVARVVMGLLTKADPITEEAL